MTIKQILKESVRIYSNALSQKGSILEDNRGKSGIYLWINKVNKKTYVGSSVDLTGRFHIYYNAKRLAASNMPIYKALLKYGNGFAY